MFGVFKKARASSNSDVLGQRYGQYPYGPPLPQEDHRGAEGLTYTPGFSGPGSHGPPWGLLQLRHAPLPSSLLSQAGVPRYVRHPAGRRDLNLSGELYYNEPVAEWAFLLTDAPKSRVKQGVPLQRMLVQVTSSVTPGINHLAGR